MSKTRVMVQAAMLVAISVVFTRFLAINAGIAGVHALRLSFGELPLMLAGILFGPAVGALAGVSADLVGIALFPPPAIFPGFTLSAAITGALPPLIVRASRRIARLGRGRRHGTEGPSGAPAAELPHSSPTSDVSEGTVDRAAVLRPRRGTPIDLPLGFGSTLTTVLFTSLVVSGLNTVWLHIMYGTPFALLLPPRLLSEAILIPAHALLLHGTLRTYAVAFMGARFGRSA